METSGPARTAPISLQGQRTALNAVTAVVAPDGLALSEESQVRVSLTFTAVPSVAEFSVPVGVVDLAEGLEASVLPASVTVRVEGPAPEVVLLTGTVSARDFAAGVHSATVRVGFLRGVDVTVAPEQVTVIVRVIPVEADGETTTESEATP